MSVFFSFVASQVTGEGFEGVASFSFDRNDAGISILHNSVSGLDILAVNGFMSFLDVMDLAVVAGYIVFEDIA